MLLFLFLLRPSLSLVIRSYVCISVCLFILYVCSTTRAGHIIETHLCARAHAQRGHPKGISLCAMCELHKTTCRTRPYIHVYVQ